MMLTRSGAFGEEIVHWGVGKMIWMDGWVGWVGSDRVRLVEHVYYKVVGVVVKGRGRGG